MKIDSIDKVTSFDSPISDPLGNDDKTIMGIYKSPSKSKVDIPVVRKSAGLSDLNYTPYKPVNITGQAKKAYDYYLNRGVKPNVAAGIVGNLYKESGLNPTAVGDKGTAFGVAQWRGDRLSNLKKYASSKGKSHTDLTTQLDFILDEKGENQVLSLMGSQSPEVAAKTFADKYERPNPQYADYSTRSSVAKQLGKMKYGGKIQLYPNGGKVKPIITNNPKDPRLVAYQDSLNLYNLSTAQYKKAKNPSKITGTSEDFTDIVNDSKVVKGNVRQFVQGDLDNNKEDNVYNNDEFVHSKIKPVGEYWWSNKGNYNPLRMTEGNKNFLYKKPNQPVVYQPKTEPKEQVIQKGSLMDSKSRVVKTPKGRVAYSIPKYPVLQDNKPVVSQELPIDSVALPNEDKYVAPVVKQKEYTRGQQSYELNSDYVKRLHTENVTGKKMKPKLIRNAFGGFIPKYALGAGELMGLVSQGMNLGAGFIDSTNNQENPNVAKSALSGFIKGNAALPGIGGILGGISSIRDAKKQRELFQKKKDIENRETMDYFNIRSKGILNNYNTQGEQGSFYAKGGIPNPQYEVEHGEVIVGDDVKLTGGKQIASNLHKVIGKTHDQFNPNTVNGTGEDGQGGQFIFSNRLQLGGKTFAKLAEKIAKEKSKAEEMMAHNDYIFKNTGQANAEIADAKLQQLAQIQEMMKGEINPVGQFNNNPQLKKGGLIGTQKVADYQRDVLGFTGNDIDGAWGQKTQAAYELYNKKNKNSNTNISNILSSAFNKFNNNNSINKPPSNELNNNLSNPPSISNPNQPDIPILNTPRRKRELMSGLNGAIKPRINELSNTKPNLDNKPINIYKPNSIENSQNWLQNWYSTRNTVTQPIDIKDNAFDYVQNNNKVNRLGQNTNAYYSATNGNTVFREGAVTASTSVHEFTHSIDDRYGDNINNSSTPYGRNKEPLKTDYRELGIKPNKHNTGLNREDIKYYTSPEESYARLNELRMASGFEPNKVVTKEDIIKLKRNNRNNHLFMFYSDEDIMNMWNGLSSNLQRESFSEQLNGDNGLRNARYGGVIHRFRLGGFIPKYVGGGELTAEQAYEQAYKNLERAAKARATKAANSAAKKAADVAYEAAYKTEQELAKKVGESVVKKTAERLTGSTLMKGLGIAGRLATAAQVYGTAGVMTYAGMKDAEKRGGFYSGYGYYAGMKKPSNILNISKTNPNKLTIPERRALRNAIPTATPSAPTTPQGTNRPSGNRLNLNKNKVNPLATENANLPVQSGNSQPNQFTGTVEPYSVNLPKEEIDFSYSVQGNNNFSPIRKVREKGSGINTDDLAPVAGALMNGVNYFANQNMINKYKTQTPATLLQNPNYQYFDRSGNTRNSVRGITNTIMNNPFVNQGTKQAALANSMNVMNDVNQQELNRKQEYDKTYRTQQLLTENRNTMILNETRQQTMQNENQKQGLRQDNLNNLFTNVNTNLSEFQANKQQDKAMQYMSLPYFKRVGLLTKEQQAEFMKNPISFLMGENELPKNKKGGRIKMKYC